MSDDKAMRKDPVYVSGWNDALEWAAKWITGALDGYSEDVANFAKANAMTIRSMIEPIPQQSFFDAVRDDPYMSAEQKAYWLQKEPVRPEGDAIYWRARAERAEATVKADLDREGIANLLNDFDTARAEYETLHTRVKNAIEPFELPENLRDATLATKVEELMLRYAVMEQEQDDAQSRANRLEATLREIEVIMDNFEKSRSAVSVLLYNIRERIVLSRGK